MEAINILIFINERMQNHHLQSKEEGRVTYHFESPIMHVGRLSVKGSDYVATTEL